MLQEFLCMRESKCSCIYRRRLGVIWCLSSWRNQYRLTFKLRQYISSLSFFLVVLIGVSESIKFYGENVKRGRWRDDPLPKRINRSYVFVAAILSKLFSAPSESFECFREPWFVVQNLPIIREDDGDSTGACGVVAGDLHRLSCNILDLGFNGLCAPARCTAYDGIDGPTVLTVSALKRPRKRKITTPIILTIHSVALIAVVSGFGQIVDSFFNGVKLQDRPNLFACGLVVVGVVAAKVTVFWGVQSFGVIAKSGFNSDRCSSSSHFLSCFRLGSSPLGVF